MKREKPIKMTFSPAGPGQVKVTTGRTKSAKPAITNPPTLGERVTRRTAALPADKRNYKPSPGFFGLYPREAYSMVIDFVKVRRDCPANTNVISKHNAEGKSGKPRGLIYDYDVMINGELRGIMRKLYTGTGYELANLVLDHWRYRITDSEMAERIRMGQKNVSQWSYTKRSTDKTADFRKDVMLAYNEGHLITAGEAANIRKKRHKEAAAEKVKNYQEACMAAIRSEGVALHDALVEIQATIQRLPVGPHTRPTMQAILRFAQKALDKVKLPAKSDHGL